jgi:hypothetical protein
MLENYVLSKAKELIKKILFMLSNDWLRTVKYKEVYLKAYQDGRDIKTNIGDYFRF